MNIEKLYQTIKNWFRPYTKDEQEKIIKILRLAKVSHPPGTVIDMGYAQFEVIDVEWDYKMGCPVVYCFEQKSGMSKDLWITDYKL